MRDLDYLKLLSHEYASADTVAAEIINLRATCRLPKGTEYFFSDLHGEHQAFIHMLRSCSGSVKDKIQETFQNELSEAEQLELAQLIYYPERQLKRQKSIEKHSLEWQEQTIRRLIAVARTVSAKWTHRSVRKALPTAYAHVLDELLIMEQASHDDLSAYYQQIMETLLAVDAGYDCIEKLCTLIRELLMYSLHIIGDIFDRGPRPDLIFDELFRIPKVDIQWGNHDVSWIGAAAGNDACIATVLRIATAYNCFDVLEEGYRINLRPLSMFAQEVYGNDPCTCFRPHLLDENQFDEVNPDLAAKMCKAISVIEFKVEGQLIMRHPEYRMADRLLLDKINFENGTVMINGTAYPLKDTSFPTIDPADPYRLSDGERELMDVLRLSFLHASRLQSHIRFLFSHGSMYLCRNGNLLYHGCIPMNEDGSFTWTSFLGRPLFGKALMDELDLLCTRAYFSATSSEGVPISNETDIFWYLWCGAESPLFGKDKMATFESFLLDEPSLKKENYNPYYKYSTTTRTAMRILEEFGLDGERGHIINGHVPVKVNKGEIPVKADGKLFVIDGGISKAYQKKTGIAGYTLIYNSHRLALAEHMPFQPGEEDTPKITTVEEMKERVLVKDIDEGKEAIAKIRDLEQLLTAYRQGLLKSAE